MVALDPGLVKTDLNPEGAMSAQEVVTSMVRVVNSLEKANTGTFVGWKEEAIGW